MGGEELGVVTVLTFWTLAALFHSMNYKGLTQPTFLIQFLVL